jgi:hypothetical protein
MLLRRCASGVLMLMLLQCTHQPAAQLGVAGAAGAPAEAGLQGKCLQEDEVRSSSDR